jgi:hypothetical protein
MSLMTQTLLFIFFISASLTPLFVFAGWQTPPEQFTSAGEGQSPDIAANSSGKAMAVWIDDSVVKGSLFSNGAWGAVTSISTNSGANSSSQVAYDDSGNGLAIWVASAATHSVYSAFFNGTTWSIPPISPLDSSTDTYQSPSIAMDGSGNGIAAWIDLTAGEVRSSTFSSSFWNVSATIGTGDGTVSIAENKNDAAVAVWTNGGVVTVNHYTSGSWKTATPIGEAGDISPQGGIDSNGNAHAVWLLTPEGTVKTSTFNGIGWSTPQVLSIAGTGNSDPSLAVAPGGTAVATWIDSSSLLQSSIYNGTSWSAPLPVAATPPASQADVAIAANGNALILWASSNGIQSAVLPLGGSWSLQQTVATLSNPPSRIAAAISSTGTAFGVWMETQNVFGSFNLGIIPPGPPASIKGKTRNNSSAIQIDRLHIITFTPSTDSSVVFYRLRRNGNIMAEISGKGPFEYIDHHRCKNKNDVYTLTSVNAGGVESTPLTVTLH